MFQDGSTLVGDKLTRARSRIADFPIMIALYSVTTASFVHVESWCQQELAHSVRSLELALHVTQPVGTPENMGLSEVIQTSLPGKYIAATDDKMNHTFFSHLTETTPETASRY